MRRKKMDAACGTRGCRYNDHFRLRESARELILPQHRRQPRQNRRATSETAESTDETAAADDGALVIKEQGIFSAGGTTITSNGTFDPEDQWEESGAGQTAHVDHANVLYQTRRMRQNFRWCSYTVTDSPEWAG